MWKFLPIIYRTRDFDYSYAVDLFLFQLQNTATFLKEGKTWTIDANYNGQRLQTIVNLAKKVQEEDYGIEYQDIVKARYGEGCLDFTFEDTGNGSSKLGQKYEKWANYKEIDDFHTAEFTKSIAKQERARKLVYKMLNEHLRKCWD